MSHIFDPCQSARTHPKPAPRGPGKRTKPHAIAFLTDLSERLPAETIAPSCKPFESVAAAVLKPKTLLGPEILEIFHARPQAVMVRGLLRTLGWIRFGTLGR
jgi:hypothetical protein